MTTDRLASPHEHVFLGDNHVAVVGLGVNLVCAWLLRDDHAHHGHDHGHHHPHPARHGANEEHDGHQGPEGHHAARESGHATDNNLRAAYLHVLADALTSVLAIVALLLGSLYGWNWLDPAMGIVGGLVIARWSWGLIRDAGAVLLDYLPADENLPDEIRDALADTGAEITDLHVWQLGPGHHGAIISLRTERREAPAFYRDKLAHIHDLAHVTVEIEQGA